MQKSISAQKTFYALFFLILVLIPFHGFLSTWIGTLSGNLLLTKIWKEILLFLFCLLLVSLLARDEKLRKKLLKRRVNRAIILYSLLHLGWWILWRPEADAAAAGIMLNLRFLIFFVLAQVLVHYYSRVKLQKTATKIIFITSMIVVLFGALQIFVLPNNFLSNFGYSSETIKPFYTIDENQEFARINSTLRGPNPLGMYLILPISMIIAFAFQKKDWRYLFILIPYLITLFGSHSRSAWLGTLVSALVLALFYLNKGLLKKSLVGIFIVFVILLPFAIKSVGSSYYLQNIFLHTNPSESQDEDSTQVHFRALGDATKDVIKNPMGDGPGTAGPASAHNGEVTRYSENYYLQITQEVGIIGLTLFLIINWLVMLNLWQQKSQTWPRVLMASFTGILVVNLFLHGWANEEIALTWWGMAGLWYRL
ncbi:O-antigen ligase domain-containing protein [Candidatus Saccharibacteria bacterium CPR2]|nr:O-antigen ligase domain-containing protein [Candidatus Saccharibacteria bacterium CPR2]